MDNPVKSSTPADVAAAGASTPAPADNRRLWAG